MNKREIKIVVDELRKDISYPDVSVDPLFGCGLPDFPKQKMVRKEVIVNHLRWQSMNLDGTIDEEELSISLEILRERRVIMV